MFSKRLPEDLEPNEFTRILQATKAAGNRILDLTQSNPTRASFSFDFLQTGDTPGGIPHIYEPSAQGLPGAREAIRRYYQGNGHGSIAADDLFLTAGTSEAYGFLLKLLTEPGDEVLIPAPSYPLFDLLATLENVKPVRYDLILDGKGRWRIDFQSLELMISSLTRAIVVVNPNNPTGSYLTPDELERLNSLCRIHELALVIDEVFLDYIKQGQSKKPFSAINNRGALTFTLSGLSKVLALPQTKLGWIHVGGPDAEKEAAKIRLEFVTDTYLSVGSMIQQTAPALLACQQEIQPQILSRIEANEAALRAGIGLPVIHREGGWYAILELPDPLTDEECCLALLKDRSLIVHPGFFYDFAEADKIVVSLIVPPEEFAEGLAILREYLAGRGV